MGQTTRLPPPRFSGAVAVESALVGRRSLREFSRVALGLPELSQVLWAAQGVTSPDGRRTAPSAGALYPLEMYAVAGDVTDLTAGVYRYLPTDHALVLVAGGDRRKALAAAALDQDWMVPAPAALVIAAALERMARKYRARGEQYVHFEAGCAAQGVALQVLALGLGTVVVAAIDEGEVARVVALRRDERPLAILPVGRR
jgi:SagB-type dehydrogenase family enzyme